MLRTQHLGALEQGRHRLDNPRERHLAQILSFLRENGSSSRAQVAADCGLGISTMSELIGELRGRRLVSESEPVRTRTVGRPLREVRLDADHWLVAGLHLDERTIRAKLATLDGEELTRVCQPWTVPAEHTGSPSFDPPAPETPSAGRSHPEPSNPADSGSGYPVGHRAALRAVVAELLAACPPDRELIALEVGLPGTVDRLDGRLVNSESIGLVDHPLGQDTLDVLDELGLRSVAVGVDNDCNFAALAASVNAPSERPNRITVYIGGERGIGGTIVIGDQLLRGSGGGAGEFGHWTIDPHGLNCWCGRRGCLATEAELDRLLTHTGVTEADARTQVAEDPSAVVEAINSAITDGDSRTRQALGQVGTWLGSVLDAIQALLDPDEVFIGGFLGALGPHLEQPLRERFEVGGRLTPKERVKIRLVSESPDVVVDGALMSARKIVLNHPLHFSTGLPLPEERSSYGDRIG